MQEVGRQVQVGQVTEAFHHHRSDQESDSEGCRIDLMELVSPSSSVNLTVGSLGVGRDQEIGQIGPARLAEALTKALVALRLPVVVLSPSQLK